MYGVLTLWPVVSACKCVERKSISTAVGCLSVRTTCVVSAKHVWCSHSLARRESVVNVRLFRLLLGVGQCVVSAEHVFDR